MTRVRLSAKDSKAGILKAVAPAAVRVGYKLITRERAAEAAGVSPSAITYHFGGMNNFRVALVRYAISTENLRIIAQAIAAQDKTASEAAPELRQRALGSLV